MKTPREILLERHHASDAKLDALRANIITNELRRPAADPSSPPLMRAALALWRELVLPCPRIWSVVAAAWVVIATLHLATGASPKATRSQTATNPDNVITLREERQILAELLNPPPPPPSPAESPIVPGPRGDRRTTVRSA